MTNFNFPSTFSPVTRKWTTHYSRIEGCLRFTRYSNQRFPEKGRNWDAGHLNYAFLLKRREQSITVSLGGRGEGMGGGIEAARNRACTTDRDLRIDITCRIPITRNSTIPVECKGWETGGRVHLVGTIIGRITGAYLTRYPNARTGRVAPPSSKQERTRASI